MELTPGVDGKVRRERDVYIVRTIFGSRRCPFLDPVSMGSGGTSGEDILLHFPSNSFRS